MSVDFKIILNLNILNYFLVIGNVINLSGKPKTMVL